MNADLAPKADYTVSPKLSAKQARDGTPSLLLSRNRLWFWGTRSVFSLLDQGLLSGSSLLLNVALARWLGMDGYGAFAVCFAGYLFVSGIHNVLVVEPMTVMGSSRYSARLSDYFSGQIRVHFIVVLGISLLGLIAAALLHSSAGKPLFSVVFAAAIGLPFILLLLVTRRMCYVVQNPLIALQASIIYSTILLGAIAVLLLIHQLTPANAFLIMALASLFPSVFILNRLGLPVVATLRSHTSPVVRLLKENWGYGYWLVLTSILSWMSVQMQTVLTAGLLDLRAGGALRAMQLPSLLMSQLIAAAMLLLLPSMSQELGRGEASRLHQKVVLVSAGLVVSGLAFTAVLLLAAAPLEHLLFGGRYASEAWLMPVLSLAPVFTGLSSGLSYALRTLRKSRFELLAYVVSATFATSSALLLVPRWGLRGAAISIIGSTAVLAVVVICCYLKWGRSSNESPDTVPGETTA